MCCIDVGLLIVDEEYIRRRKAAFCFYRAKEALIGFGATKLCRVVHIVEAALQLQPVPDVPGSLMLLHRGEVKLHSGRPDRVKLRKQTMIEVSIVFEPVSR